jgi:N utilization substance protein B
MNARRAARELLLILFSQLKKNAENINEETISDVVLKSVRILVNSSQEELEITSGALVDMQDFIYDLELNDEKNLERPFEATNLPVPIPMTSDMQKKVDSMVDIADKAFQALEIAELCVLSQTQEVKDFIINITKTYQKNRQEIKELINESSIGWDINRILKIDKDIMKIAITELLYIKDAPVKVIIDEAVELAKKYSSEESTAFINGILGKVVKVKELKAMN